MQLRPRIDERAGHCHRADSSGSALWSLLWSDDQPSIAATTAARFNDGSSPSTFFT
jgi:hypothetical protein